MADNASNETILNLAVQIVSAHVKHNKVDSDALPSFIEQVYRTLETIGSAPEEQPRPTPAVPLKRSVFADHIVCLEDGKKLKMLKRHLMTDHQLTPDQYRERWGLPRDYPMVATDYAAKRSALAKKIGLGRKPARLPARLVAKAAPKAARGTRKSGRLAR
jgi:predicted transcriptional regulator